MISIDNNTIIIIIAIGGSSMMIMTAGTDKSRPQAASALASGCSLCR